MTLDIRSILKSPLSQDFSQKENGIFEYINPDFIIGDNKKYMGMYDKLARWYDFGEKWIGWLKYGNSIAKMRTHLMSQLEWKNNARVLYVSIGTGTDLQFIPKNIDLKTLDFVGLDISLGMLQKCQKKWNQKTNLSLVHGSAEDLPFADNSFDVVFHSGGINFFSDKAKAISEMIRVAKPGTKILIADETADYIDSQYKKSSFSKEYFDDATFDSGEIENAIPDSVHEKNLEFVWDKKFYAITFRK